MASRKPNNLRDVTTNPKGKSTKRRRRSMSKGRTEGEIHDTTREGSNDPAWYGNPDYVKSVSQFNFVSPLGKPVPYQYFNDPNSVLSYVDSSNDFLGVIPGIMAIDILPTIGKAEGPVDAVNTYFRAFFTKLRSTNNQSAPYQGPDLGMYTVAIDSIHMGIEQLVRMYGVARTYNAMNRYYPDAVLQACGIDPKSDSFNLYANLADFRAMILNLLTKVQSIAVPKGIRFNERHRELVKYIYSDGNTSKSQGYLFRTKYLYKYKWDYSEFGSGLQAVEMPIGGSATQWVGIINDMIDAILLDQDAAIISGDIIKAYGYENLYVMPWLEETYSVIPVMNPEMLLEIHNSRSIGERFSDTSFDITQDGSMNCIINRPIAGVTTISDLPVCPIIDIPLENPTPSDVMVATRFTCMGWCGLKDPTETGPKYKVVPNAFGSELVISYTIYSYDVAGVLNSKIYASRISSVNSSSLYGYMQFSAFDWAPLRYWLVAGTAESTANTGYFHGVVGELSNYTVMDYGDLVKLHDVALYGLLSVSGVDNVGQYLQKK